MRKESSEWSIVALFADLLVVGPRKEVMRPAPFKVTLTCKYKSVYKLGPCSVDNGKRYQSSGFDHLAELQYSKWYEQKSFHDHNYGINDYFWILIFGIIFWMQRPSKTIEKIVPAAFWTFSNRQLTTFRDQFISIFDENQQSDLFFRYHQTNDPDFSQTYFVMSGSL